MKFKNNKNELCDLVTGPELKVNIHSQLIIHEGQTLTLKYHVFWNPAVKFWNVIKQTLAFISLSLCPFQ